MTWMLQKIVALTKSDKKMRGGKIRFVLLGPESRHARNQDDYRNR